MGWLALALVGAAAGAALWLGRMPRGLAAIAAAALMLGATGYALQGRPRLAGQPATSAAQGLTIEPGMVAFRSAILGDAHRAPWSLADAALARGDARESVAILIDTVRRAPRDASAWTALGTGLAIHDGQQLSPSARFAFAQAIRLDPHAPGPPFFLGLALLNSGELEPARTAWHRALALVPADAPYRDDVATRVLMADRFIAMMAGTPPSRP
ncbi:tetratricopeptide repeat protein [Sphingomonas japonica]|uniref:Cytochrome c-type biogenesis protein CcmH/NrfG n=1 Tax=Sphingomonas japonica TaxID=511662 RepID=A0ABX0TWS1_9SPHN|nr:cytochrome C biosynthesis protein [Sphingomonas japonica]NIJ22771.1 cytochrome c-type biogenesis protein CcmH/NrfG [Sphingomonas japonica]